MFNFIVCEDNLNTGTIIKELISDYISEKHVESQVFLFDSHFERVVDFAERNLGHINVYFLDIVLNEDNRTGLTIARQIRKIDMMAYFIFISSHPELSLKIFQYKLKALDYIYKQDENIQKRINDCIDMIIYETEQFGVMDITRTITLKNNNQFYTVSLKDILYFETRPCSRMLYCKLTDGTVIEFSDSLKSVLQHLDSRFYQCHRSYIINIRQIKKMGNDNRVYSVTMSDGKICDVSRPKWRELVNRVRN